MTGCLADIKLVPEECEIAEEVVCRHIGNNPSLWKAGVRGLSNTKLSHVCRVVKLHNGKIKPIFFAQGWERISTHPNFDLAMAKVFTAFPTAVEIYRDVSSKLPPQAPQPELCFGFFIRKSLDQYQIWRKPSHCCYDHFVQDVTTLGQHVWGVEGVMFGYFVPPKNQENARESKKCLLYGLTATLDHPPACSPQEIYLTMDFPAEETAYFIQGLWWSDGEDLRKLVPMNEEVSTRFHQTAPVLDPFLLARCLCPKGRLELN